MTNQLELIFEKDIVDFSKLFSIVPNVDLADEFLAYTQEDDKITEEYRALLGEITKRKGKKSVESWAKNYRLTETDKKDKKDLKFYNILDKRKISSNLGKISLLRNVIKEAYNYFSLWAGSNKVKDKSGKIVKKCYMESLESADPDIIRRFSINRYSLGREIFHRLAIR